MVTRKLVGAATAVILTLFPLAACDPPSPGPMETLAPQETPMQQEPPPVAPDPQARGAYEGPLQQPADPPEVGTAPLPAGVPDPTSVRGGGPLNSDAAAVARINQQLPVIPQMYQLSGTAAVGYANRITAAFPAFAPTFQRVLKVANCGTDYGVIGAKAFIDRNYQAAAVMVVLSRKQLQQLPRIALSCFIGEPIGGGGGGGVPPEGAFSPCVKTYYYDRNMNGVVDRYFTIVGATHQNYCSYLQSVHSSFRPQAFTL